MPDDHMTPDEFREYGKEVIDWIADYYKWVETYPVLSQVKPGDIRSGLPPSAPQKGESMSAMLDDMDHLIMPGITHWQSPNFFAFYPCNSSGPGILGELLSAGLNVQGMNWVTSPACTELEAHVLDWLVEMLDLPEKFRSTNAGGGVIQDTASSATLCATLAARERATDGQSNHVGADHSLVAYASHESHSSIEKALRIAGIGTDRMRVIPTDESYAMDAHELEDQILRDKAEDFKPFIVYGTVGSTSSGSLDPLESIGSICQREGIWFHVDAAMLGTAALCPEFRYIQEGLEYADSYCFNPHKWMFTNFDCDCLFVADRNALTRALTINREYLGDFPSKSAGEDNYRDWQIPLGRRFRSLKLWFVIRYYGVEGLQKHIREHVEMAQEFARWVDDDPNFERLAPVSLQLVCFAHTAGNDITKSLLDSINASGKIYLSQTMLRGRFTIRISIGQANTRKRHVRAAWELIQKTARELAL